VSKTFFLNNWSKFEVVIDKSCGGTFFPDTVYCINFSNSKNFQQMLLCVHRVGFAAEAIAKFVTEKTAVQVVINVLLLILDRLSLLLLIDSSVVNAYDLFCYFSDLYLID